MWRRLLWREVLLYNLRDPYDVDGNRRWAEQIEAGRAALAGRET
jgi:hypothetical protein